jgi:hypothetical protein
LKEYVLTEKLIVEGFHDFIKILEEDTVLHVNAESVVGLFELHIREDFIKEDFIKNLNTLFSLLSDSKRLNSDKDLIQSDPLLVLSTNDAKIYIKLFTVSPENLENDLLSYNKKYGTSLCLLETFTGYYAGESKLPLLVTNLDYGRDFQYLTKDIRIFTPNFLSDNLYNYLKRLSRSDS